MPFKLGPLVSRVSGHWGGKQKYKATLREDGTLRIGKRRPGLGAPEKENTRIQWGQMAYKYLDWRWSLLSPAQILEWRRCIPRTASRHWSCFSYYKHVNALRIHYDMPAIDSPPNRFKSHKVYLKPWNANPASQKYAEHPVWQDGETKDDTPFDEHSPKPPYPHPPPTCWLPSIHALPHVCPYGPRELHAYFRVNLLWLLPPFPAPYIDFHQFWFSTNDETIYDCDWLGGHPTGGREVLYDWTFAPGDLWFTLVWSPQHNRPPGGYHSFPLSCIRKNRLTGQVKRCTLMYAHPATSDRPLGTYSRGPVPDWLIGILPCTIYMEAGEYSPPAPMPPTSFLEDFFFFCPDL